jgi:hypothetical protein
LLDADADRVDLESRLIKLLLEDRARIRFPVTAAHGAKRPFVQSYGAQTRFTIDV